MNVYTIKTIKTGGEYDEEWGQTFFADVEESDNYIIFTKKINYIPKVGTRIMAEHQKEGEDKLHRGFFRLSKVSIEEDAPEGTPFTEKPVKKDDKSSQPVFKVDDKRGITKSMAVKLAYVEFVRCEGMLPYDIDHWNVIQANARNLMWTIDGLDDEPVEEFSDAEPGRAKARKVREQLDDDAEE